MDELSKSKIIKIEVLNFFKKKPENYLCKSEDIVIYVRRFIPITYEDTILRGMRSLRQHGLIDYICLNKSTRDLKINIK